MENLKVVVYYEPRMVRVLPYDTVGLFPQVKPGGFLCARLLGR